MNSANFLINDEQKKVIASITPIVEGKFYTMDYTSDYCFDDAMASGLVTLDDIKNFAGMKLIDGRKLLEAMKAMNSGCSVFAGKNSEGEPLLARNYDYSHDETGLIGLMVRCNPKNGYKSIGMADLGFMGVGNGAFEDGKTDLSMLMLTPYGTVDGFNEKGLSIAALALSHDGVAQNTGKKKIGTTLAIRMVLDKAATVNEAIELLSQYDIQSAMKDSDFHFMLADASGMSKVVEYVQNEMRVWDARYLANTYITPYMGEQLHQPRFDMLESYITHCKDRFEADDAFAFLRCVSQDKTINRGGSMTRWSAVINLKKLSMELYYDRDWTKKYSFTL